MGKSKKNQLTKHTSTEQSKSSFGRILTNRNFASDKPQGIQLASDSRTTARFKLSIEHVLENNYQFKDMRVEDIKNFSKFITSTVGRGLTITQVESSLLRTDGPHGAKNIEQVDGEKKEMYHFGQDRTKFRVHGYYNDEDYFVIHRIDPQHKKFK
ncbi:hypothetical protein BVJ53_07325 [Lacticaseibacillus chiayiensis]|uniref:Uncharacterized protein n=1 Tax=Lacticaseibacillus chiayiensis TaxID=2100821 RepID=A0A4Q1U1I9_9LACO|nr:hypothetical protein [Lacticaseibacillus chiayiensis]RXT17739.1 hypothetical protein BVJ53_14350 [Lacticaseibacillus chiayiensis]RXT24555.1 hypothetical protein BVJ53_07325 [Lacticaseibacillus chiayiensis]